MGLIDMPGAKALLQLGIKQQPRCILHDVARLGRRAGGFEPNIKLVSGLPHGRKLDVDFSAVHSGDGASLAPIARTVRIVVRIILVEENGNKQIAQKLFRAEQTAENHISTIYTKMGVRNRAQAVKLAYQIASLRPS